MDQVRDTVVQLHAQGVAALADKLRGDTFTITVGPGDSVPVPAGCLACERTLGQASCVWPAQVGVDLYQRCVPSVAETRRTP